jgi:hypothetical protein
MTFLMMVKVVLQRRLLALVVAAGKQARLTLAGALAGLLREPLTPTSTV